MVTVGRLTLFELAVIEVQQLPALRGHRGHVTFKLVRGEGENVVGEESGVGHFPLFQRKRDLK
jgi:hypothetical protein